MKERKVQEPDVVQFIDIEGEQDEPEEVTQEQPQAGSEPPVETPPCKCSISWSSLTDAVEVETLGVTLADCLQAQAVLKELWGIKQLSKQGEG